MIDYVVPMVFPDDPEWREDLRRVKGNEWQDATEDVRYRSWQTEHLLVRCVRKFMPWVRDIIIILARDSQRQPWMEDKGIRVVLHSDFMPADKLPTFNSRAIEMYLHRIPGLSERFLYGNDDMFPLSPLKETDFFVGSLPCQRFREKPFPMPPSQYHLACIGGLNFVSEEFGLEYTDKWLKNGHSIAPILKSSCHHLWQRGAKEIERNVTPFREIRNFNQYIYGWYQHFTDNYVERVPKRMYISVKASIDEIVKKIQDPNAGIVCINDHECVDDIRHYAKAVREAIERKLKA